MAKGKARNDQAAGEAQPEAQADKKPQMKSVIWTGEKDPPSSVRIGMKVIQLPDAATQRKGFETEHADALARNVKDFKFLKPKGGK